MVSRRRITAGQVEDIEAVRVNPVLLRDWIFVDIGFSSTEESCGVAIGKDDPEEVTFANLVKKLAAQVAEVEKPHKPLNLLLEAPLSIAFTTDGNPTARVFESKKESTPPKLAELMDDTHRGWYYNAGANTMAGATRLIWELRKCKRRRDIRLFEGYAPRESERRDEIKSKKGDHAKVVRQLRALVKGEIRCPVLSPGKITVDLHVWPIVGIEGWDSHKPPKDNMIPPVVWVPPKCLGEEPESTIGQCPCAIVRNQVP